MHDDATWRRVGDVIILFRRSVTIEELLTLYAITVSLPQFNYVFQRLVGTWMQ